MLVDTGDPYQRRGVCEAWQEVAVIKVLMPAVVGPEPLAARLLLLAGGLRGLGLLLAGFLGQREGLEAAAGGSLGVECEEPPRNCTASATCGRC